MRSAIKESLLSLMNFAETAAMHGLGFTAELSDKVIEQTLPMLNNSVKRVQRRLTRNNIIDTPLVSPRPVISGSSLMKDENGIIQSVVSYSAPVETYGRLSLPQPWAYIFIEPKRILARWRRNKPYRSEDDKEPFDLSTKHLLKLWWDAPSDHSAGTGDEGLISKTGRLFYTPQTLLLMLEAMRTARINNREICPYDSYSHFVDLTRTHSPELAQYAEHERACFLENKPHNHPYY